MNPANLRNLTRQCSEFVIKKQGEMFQDKQEIKEKSQNEVAEWVKLSEEHLHVLQRLQKVCFYCSERMTPISVNLECPVNSLKKLPEKCKKPSNQQFPGSAKMSRRGNFTRTGDTSSMSHARKAEKRRTRICRACPIN